MQFGMTAFYVLTVVFSMLCSPCCVHHFCCKASVIWCNILPAAQTVALVYWSTQNTGATAMLAVKALRAVINKQER